MSDCDNVTQVNSRAWGETDEGKHLKTKDEDPSFFFLGRFVLFLLYLLKWLSKSLQLFEFKLLLRFLIKLTSVHSNR
jgi:hypothetical protein